MNKEIQVKESNIEIKKGNDMVKKTITLLSDLIENNNVKIINIVKSETYLKFNLTKYNSTIEDFNENKERLKELNDETQILGYFISMSHHNGIPSFLIKKITNLLQDNVNLILSEYSDMKVKIKNESKETSIRIWNDKSKSDANISDALVGQAYKNGLNAKMLCGSEKFLVELAFRVAFQTLSNVSKPNFFICDEGWSCLDEKTRSNLDCVLKTLLGYNEYVLTVSHIDDVRKWMNNHIKIVVDDNNCRHISQ
jgi:DNA repair exonuclease SbcCD ATPase subunit